MPRTSKSLVLFVVSAAIVFDALDLSITQIALPSIGADLDIGEGGLPWVANAYVLTYGGLLLLGGRMADLVGRRRTFVLGLSLFGAMSLACGLAPGAPVLVVARALQGIGAALTVPAAVSLIANVRRGGAAQPRAGGLRCVRERGVRGGARARRARDRRAELALDLPRQGTGGVGRHAHRHTGRRRGPAAPGAPLVRSGRRG
jgi:MFS family permease